ncbi:hypothetical protein [Stieleria varia]|uniref:Uncharacterized protein n=1 Tax=Stieleria varia TaxID=2528005 RepID=A0A5C6AQP7_9BACT|nr:hypothetical protein [Stieleria varia]TWU01302.1 hypothetical protein Pla52n_46760 [Stieleria varia]
MLGEFKVSRCTRQCFVEKRPLADGEWYYSVVVESGDDLERRDYSAAAWDGPPEGAIGHWKCRMPLSDQKKMVLAPREVLIDLLRQMESFPEKAKTRYLLALLLLRRRFVRLADTATLTSQPSGSAPESENAESENAEPEIMHVEVVDDGSSIDVLVCDIARSETEALTESLNELLYCEASELAVPE